MKEYIVYDTVLDEDINTFSNYKEAVEFKNNLIENDFTGVCIIERNIRKEKLDEILS